MQAAVAVFSLIEPDPQYAAIVQFHRVQNGLADASQRVVQIITEGRAALSAPEVTQWKVLALARWDLLRALTRIVDLSRSDDLATLLGQRGDLKARSGLLSAPLIELRGRYDAFVQRWALTSPLSVHDRYRQEALLMSHQIEQSIKTFISELTQLLDVRTAFTGCASN